VLIVDITCESDDPCQLGTCIGESAVGMYGVVPFKCLVRMTLPEAGDGDRLSKHLNSPLSLGV
jgi:hypothetical protein